MLIKPHVVAGTQKGRKELPNLKTNYKTALTRNLKQAKKKVLKNIRYFEKKYKRNIF